MRRWPLALAVFAVCLGVCSAANKLHKRTRYVLEDLIAVEDSRPDDRRIVSITDDDPNQAKTRKHRQNGVEDTIRTVQEPITGPGRPAPAPKDKGGGSERDREDDEDRKTLAQQVQDGKYGLIQTEIFNEKPTRPGIISYEVNPEVPKDNVNNLGGLKSEEIWLAENHLLVLAGGGFSDERHNALWAPIDNYIAPRRQVKIPPNPKVPPPFPVQLKPGGPLEFIKNENGTGGPSPTGPPFFPFPNQGNFSQGNGYLPPPFPFLPQPPNGSIFLPPPGFLPPIPPGAAFLPPPGNITEPFDEDDPSIYYPPPYDFYYPKDNSSLVPAGPLVPGIVLPPPPDFFAPLKSATTSNKPRNRPPVSRIPPKSKTPTRKPTKHKNVQIVSGDDGRYDSVDIRPNIGQVHIQTTPPPYVYTTPPPVYTTPPPVYKTPPPIYTTTLSPPITTEIYTRRPTVKTTTDSSLNEITPPPIVHALPPNAVVKGWVPIPAPDPYYITRPRKPSRKGTTTTLPPDYNSLTPPKDTGYVYNTPDYELTVNGWLYPNKTKNYDQDQYYKTVVESPKQEFYYDDFYAGKNQYHSTTESPLSLDDQTKVKNLYYPTRSPQESTISPAALYGTHMENRGKALKTYYFYEEPHISEGKLTDTDYSGPPVRTKYQQNPHTITEEVYINSAAKQSNRGQFKPSPLDYFYPQNDYVQQKATTESPLKYYYVAENPKQYDAPYPPPVTTPAPTTKPPVYEYSFSIPGYGSLDPPKVGLARPDYEPKYQTTARPYVQQYTTPAPTTISSIYKNQHHGETQYYTTQRPQNYNTQRPRPKEPTLTENPYHAFFTHQDAGLIDDITKKYFTTFGQKLNRENIRGEGLTTPLPPADDTGKYFPHTSPAPRYETDRPRYQPRPQPPRYYTTPAPVPEYPVYDQYYDQRGQSLVSTQKPISLESDLLVNYKQPLPPLNPEAEFIDPGNPNVAKPDQSFISYRLPGNGGGHFFFLTPQVVQQRQYSDYSYAEQPADHYKRNARRPQRRRPPART